MLVIILSSTLVVLLHSCCLTVFYVRPTVSVPKVNASGYLGTNTSMVSNDGCCRVCLTLSGDRTVHNGWLEAMRVANTTAHAAAEARAAATTIAAAHLRATQVNQKLINYFLKSIIF